MEAVLDGLESVRCHRTGDERREPQLCPMSFAEKKIKPFMRVDAPTGMTPTGHGGQVTGHAGLQRHFPRFRRGEWHCRNLRSGEEHSRMRCGKNVRLYKTWHLKHTNKEH